MIILDGILIIGFGLVWWSLLGISMRLDQLITRVDRAFFVARFGAPPEAAADESQSNVNH